MFVVIYANNYELKEELILCLMELTRNRDSDVRETDEETR